MYIDYASNNLQIILLWFAVPFSNYTKKRLNNREGSASSYVIWEVRWQSVLFGSLERELTANVNTLSLLQKSYYFM
jgi:hypothetical protein